VERAHPSAVSHVAALGGGVIGQSWTALLLAAGKSVALYDPDPGAERRVRDAVAASWPTLLELGLAAADEPPDRLVVHDSAEAAVEGAQFVQESVPERVDVKHRLYAEIEPALDASTVVASSASGLTLSELQDGWLDPSRLVLGHPFNPPHLIPLVEVMGNQRTAAGVVDWTRDFYGSLGKVTIEVRREVPGHVANRLQAALWREAIHLVNEGVATVEDVDTAVSAGPGIRWAVMGPTLLFHLGAGEGGLAAFCERYTYSFNRWWDDLGHPHLDSETAARLVQGLAASPDTADVDRLTTERDRLLTAVVAATGRLRDTDHARMAAEGLPSV
jgi:carnitine 3-dehydrogenase